MSINIRPHTMKCLALQKLDSICIDDYILLMGWLAYIGIRLVKRLWFFVKHIHNYSEPLYDKSPSPLPPPPSPSLSPPSLSLPSLSLPLRSLDTCNMSGQWWWTEELIKLTTCRWCAMHIIIIIIRGHAEHAVVCI